MTLSLLAATVVTLSAMIVTGCGKPVYQVDPRVEPIVQEFIRESNGRVKEIDDLIIEFGKTKTEDDEDIIGVCEMGPWSQPKIVLDWDWYSVQSDLSKKALVYHELGHCILDRDHKNEMKDSECQSSIMDEYVLDAECFRKHYNYYIEELFSY